jgi:ubiquinone/menaquinone biosynthesis C-methylase UbiE
LKEPIRPYIEDFVHIIKPLHILDIGCGDGSLLHQLASESHEDACMHFVVGIDLCRALVEKGKKSYDHIEYLIADAEYLPFRSEVFDMAICVALLHHIFGENLKESRKIQSKVLDEIYRVLRMKGSLFLRELCPHNRIIAASFFWPSLYLTNVYSRLSSFPTQSFTIFSFLTMDELTFMLTQTFGNVETLQQKPWRPYSIPLGKNVIVNAGKKLVGN